MSTMPISGAPDRFLRIDIVQLGQTLFKGYGFICERDKETVIEAEVLAPTPPLRTRNDVILVLKHEAEFAGFVGLCEVVDDPPS